MNTIVFAKPHDIPEFRLAEFISRPKAHVHVANVLGVEHDPVSRSFDTLTIDLQALVNLGFKNIRIEVET